MKRFLVLVALFAASAARVLNSQFLELTPEEREYDRLFGRE